MPLKTKQQIRKEIRQRLNKQSQTQRLHKSRLLKEQLFELAEFKRAKYVMFYIATSQEVETRLMIAEAQKIGKKIVVPMILEEELGSTKIVACLIEDWNKELTSGPYGILQPQRNDLRRIPAEKIDLVVVPGLAFDKGGRRLGRGRGYYDRFLANLPADTPRIGLAFDFQLLANLPTLSHDIRLNKVISA